MLLPSHCHAFIPAQGWDKMCPAFSSLSLGSLAVAFKCLCSGAGAVGQNNAPASQHGPGAQDQAVAQPRSKSRSRDVLPYSPQGTEKSRSPGTLKLLFGSHKHRPHLGLCMQALHPVPFVRSESSKHDTGITIIFFCVCLFFFSLKLPFSAVFLCYEGTL